MYVDKETEALVEMTHSVAGFESQKSLASVKSKISRLARKNTTSHAVTKGLTS